jgi:hypothetical protein
MDDRFDFEGSRVTIGYVSDAVPQLHCPKTGLAIFPAMTAEGVFVDGKPLPSDTTIDYAKIPSVAFHSQTGIDGQADYFRTDVAAAIAVARQRLEADDEDLDESCMSDLEILQDHVELALGSCLILHVVLDGDEDCSTFIGLDLSA